MTIGNEQVLTPDSDESAQQLKYAIDHGGLRLQFQPVVDLRSRNIVGFEALIRWQHPILGLLVAGRFIDRAERFGLIGEIDRWVFAEACRQLGQWAVDFPRREFFIRVNMSPATLTSDSLIQDVALSMDSISKSKHLSRSSSPRIGIEITERSALGDLTAAVRAVLGLKSLGVEVGLDNWGSGHVPMNALQHLPVDFLKVSGSYIRNVVEDNYSHAIVESQVASAKALSIKVIANGIEDQRTVDALLTLGCLIGQGHIFAYPMEAIAVNHLLSGESSSCDD